MDHSLWTTAVITTQRSIYGTADIIKVKLYRYQSLIVAAIRSLWSLKELLQEKCFAKAMALLYYCLETCMTPSAAAKELLKAEVSTEACIDTDMIAEKRSAAALSFSLYISLSFRKSDIDS